MLVFTLGLVLVRAPFWLLVVAMAMAVLTLVVLFVAYIFFMARDPDALRSETYVLKKIAIEKGLIGDSTLGTFEEDISKLRREAVEQGESDR